MPLLDLSELCDDPDFVERFEVQRRAITTGANGRDTLTVRTFRCVTGVVLPDTQAGLTRGPDQQMLPDAITVHTTFRLQSEATGFQADLIIWNGSSYVVTRLNDYSHFGAGFVSAYCVSQASTEPGS